MGQFLGYQSYTRHTYCRACGERWPSEDTEHYHSCTVKNYSDEDDEEEETIEEMKQEGCYLSDEEKKENGS
tara:strand:+ start:314 stop:526 length:213 start_codon:yes stop_codon:yes gene_type:complete